MLGGRFGRKWMGFWGVMLGRLPGRGMLKRFIDSVHGLERIFQASEFVGVNEALSKLWWIVGGCW